MKKFIMIFGSVIFLLLISINKVNAEESPQFQSIEDKFLFYNDYYKMTWTYKFENAYNDFRIRFERYLIALDLDYSVDDFDVLIYRPYSDQDQIRYYVFLKDTPINAYYASYYNCLMLGQYFVYFRKYGFASDNNKDIVYSDDGTEFLSITLNNLLFENVGNDVYLSNKIYFSTVDIYDKNTGKLLVKKTDLSSNEYMYLDNFYSGLYNLNHINLDFNLKDFHDKKLEDNLLKLKIHITNFEDGNSLDNVIEYVDSTVLYRWSQKYNALSYVTDNSYLFSLNSYEYDEDNHDLYVIYQCNVDFTDFDLWPEYPDIKIDIQFKNTLENNLDFYSNLDIANIEFFKAGDDVNVGYQKVSLTKNKSYFVISSSVVSDFDLITYSKDINNLNFYRYYVNNSIFDNYNNLLYYNLVKYTEFKKMNDEKNKIFISLDPLEFYYCFIEKNINEDLYIIVPFNVLVSYINMNNNYNYAIISPNNEQVQLNANQNNNGYVNSINKNNSLSSIFKGISTFIDSLSIPINFLKKSLNYLYQKLNVNIKMFLCSILSLYLMSKIYKLIRKWY